MPHSLDSGKHKSDATLEQKRETLEGSGFCTRMSSMKTPIGPFDSPVKTEVSVMVMGFVYISIHFGDRRPQSPAFGSRVSGFGFWGSGFGFRVSGSGFRVPGFGFRSAEIGEACSRLIQRGLYRDATAHG